jgi:hypothetical protein
MTDYVVCIPSYKRAELCNEKSLTMLKNNHIPSKKIFVYVANKEEYDEYIKVLDKSKYNKLVVGIKGLVPQRQFIMEQFPEGKHIVFFDDDVSKIDLSMSSITRGKTLDYFFKHAFKECHKNKSYIWGVYPVFNPFFRKERPEMTTCLTYIVGAFYGIINRPNLKAIELTITKENGQKEDVERTLKYFVEDGIVLRFNRIGFMTKYYGKSGGLGTFEARLKPMLEASKKLKAKYPEYGEITTKKHGMTEFRLKKIPSRMEVNTEESSKNNKTKKLTKTSKNKTAKSK